MVCDEEKFFGITTKKKSPGIYTRNWITYKLRESVTQVEKEAYYAPIDASNKIKRNLQHDIEQEVQHKHLLYTNQNKLDLFYKIFAYTDMLCVKQQDG